MTPAEELLSVWRRTLAERAESPAVIDGAAERGWTFREVEELAVGERRQLPARLARRRVLLIEPNGVRWFARFLALLQADAVPVPLDPTETTQRQWEIAADIRAAGTWVGENFVATDIAHPLLDRATSLIKLTSGSTGRPQPLRFTAAQILADGHQVCRTMGIQPLDRNLVIIPCGHSYGLGNIVLPLLAQGTAAVIAPSPLPRVLAETCARWHCTVFPAVPTLLRLLAEGDVDPTQLQTLRLVITAGANLPAPVAQSFAVRYGRRIHNFYGSSETGGICFDRDGEATLSGRSVGRPLEGVTITPTAGGRFWVESEAVMTLGRRRRERDMPRGQHRPGDRGELNEHGELVLLGRAGRMTKIGGRRIELGEIEAAFRRIAGVAEAYVTAHPSVTDELAAVVQTTLGEREVRALLAAQWPPWKIPRRLICRPTLPTTSRGKLDTAALRQLTDPDSKIAKGTGPDVSPA